MDNEEFYSFSSRGYMTTFAARPALFAYAIQHNLFEKPSGRYIHDDLKYGDDLTGGYPSYIQFPVVFRQIDGKRMRDVLDMRYDGQCVLISDRMCGILRAGGITGWQTYPIILFDKKGIEIGGYNGFTVVGRGGTFEYLPGYDPIKVDEYYKYIQWRVEQWDGSDFFKISPNCVVCTKRVMQLLRIHKVEAIDYYPLSCSIIRP